ncbi:uncharacterized protein [Primulina huaijiensis]|uniref:uncharacterized protein isoform X2 n=1 Tax=Primulina huaijiensis TaxID=1492673 RepID=UPI003CC7004A
MCFGDVFFFLQNFYSCVLRKFLFVGSFRNCLFGVFMRRIHGFGVWNEAPTVEEEREDRISRLPDDVILLIVSRLYTRDAVRTSVLSRRWKHVYTFVSEVRFYCFMIRHSHLKGKNLREFRRKFVQAVDTFLQHHSGSRIKSFDLVCCFRGCNLDSLRRLMNYVGRLGVEGLTIRYCCTNHVQKSIPPIFSSDFLPEALSVKHGSFQISSQKALKDLELNDVALTYEAVECILLNCCSLQSLELNSCMLPSKLHIHGPDLQLKILRVSMCSKVAEIDLSSINLTTFELCTLRMLVLSFSNVPLLQNISINVFDRRVAPYVFVKVAKDLPNLECMYFRTDAKLFEAFEIGGVNKLSHLRQLALFLNHKNNLDLLALATVLDVCPLLHKFRLSMRVTSTFNGKRAEKIVVRHHTQLREVEFSGFSMTENEYNFILHILENVVSLERLSIFLDVYSEILGRWLCTNRNQVDRLEKQRIIRERLQGQSISKNVEIIIV